MPISYVKPGIKKMFARSKPEPTIRPKLMPAMNAIRAKGIVSDADKAGMVKGRMSDKDMKLIKASKSK